MQLTFKPKTGPPPTIVDLDRDKLTFCDNKSASMLTFPYPQATIRDLEIVDHETLSKELKNFLDSHKISPTHLVFVLSPSIYFEKNLTGVSDQDRADEIHKFLDMIPFGSISSKTFHLANDYKLVAINRDFYESIKSAFETAGFAVSAVVPNFILASIGLKDDFNIEACRLILRHMAFILENSLLTPNETEQTLAASRHYIHRHQGIFATLSLAFVAVAMLTAIYTLRRPTPPRPVSAHVSIVPTSPPSPTTAPEPTVAPAGALTVTILNASKVAGLASSLETEIRALGFEQVSIGTASVSATNTLVVYSPRVSVPLRDLLGSALSKFFTKISTSENPDSAFDIIITAGNPR